MSFCTKADTFLSPPNEFPAVVGRNKLTILPNSTWFPRGPWIFAKQYKIPMVFKGRNCHFFSEFFIGK